MPKGKGKATQESAVATVATVAKVLLGVAGLLPKPVAIVEESTGNVIPLPSPLAVPHGASKRAMARAVYMVLQGQGFTGTDLHRLAGMLLVLTGVGYCHATGKVLVGEIRGSKGLSGYIKPDSTWWNTASNEAKANALLGYAKPLCLKVLHGETEASKAIACVDTAMRAYVAKYGDDTISLD